MYYLQEFFIFYFKLVKVWVCIRLGVSLCIWCVVGEGGNNIKKIEIVKNKVLKSMKSFGRKDDKGKFEKELRIQLYFVLYIVQGNGIIFKKRFLKDKYKVK